MRSPSPARRLLSFLWTGPLMGALFFVGLFVRSILSFGGGEYMGVQDEGVVERVVGMFPEEIVALQVALLGLYVAIGAVAGVLASLHWRVVAAVKNAPMHTGLALAWRVLLTVALYHVWFLARLMITHPQVVADQFYSPGGLWAALQALLTDHVPPDALDTIAFTYLTVIVGATIITVVRSTRGRTVSPKVLWPWVGILGLVSGVAVALSFDRDEPPVTDNNLLIIAVDSLRPDRLAADAPRPLPTLQAFARESIRFESAWTVMPRTFPSWVSILTGRYPHEHGIRHMFPGPEQLAKPRETLFSRLRDQGYRTGVVSDFAGDIFSRVQLGFDGVRVPRFTLRANVELGAYKVHYHLMPYLLTVLGGHPRYPIFKLWERLADPSELTEETLAWLDRGDDRPFALLVFYSAPHFPYATRWPWYKLYKADDYEGPSRYHKASWTQTEEAPGAAEQTQIKALYDGSLAATDQAIGRLLGRLDARGVLDKTTVLVTADHGENLYEEGFGIGHGDHLRGSAALRIPLLLRPAGAAPRRTVTADVRSIDIAPTLLDYLDQPPLAKAHGESLRPLAEGQQRAEDPPVFFETGLWFISPEAEVLKGRTMTFADGFGAFRPDPDTHEIYFDEQFDDDFLVAKHRAILHDGYKLLYIPTRQGVIWELYDVRNDPDERTDLIDRRPERADTLRRRLKAWMLSDPAMMELGEYVVPRLAQ